MLKLDGHARDKFLRLVGSRYEASTDIVTLVADRCPVRKQNLDYLWYLLTVLNYESKVNIAEVYCTCNYLINIGPF